MMDETQLKDQKKTQRQQTISQHNNLSIDSLRVRSNIRRLGNVPQILED